MKLLEPIKQLVVQCVGKSKRRIKRDAGGRKKNPMAQLVRSPLYKPKVEPSGKTYIRSTRKKQLFKSS